MTGQELLERLQEMSEAGLKRRVCFFDGETLKELSALHSIFPGPRFEKKEFIFLDGEE